MLGFKPDPDYEIHSVEQCGTNKRRKNLKTLPNYVCITRSILNGSKDSIGFSFEVGKVFGDGKRYTENFHFVPKFITFHSKKAQKNRIVLNGERITFSL